MIDDRFEFDEDSVTDDNASTEREPVIYVEDGEDHVHGPECYNEPGSKPTDAQMKVMEATDAVVQEYVKLLGAAMLVKDLVRGRSAMLKFANLFETHPREFFKIAEAMYIQYAETVVNGFSAERKATHPEEFDENGTWVGDVE